MSFGRSGARAVRMNIHQGLDGLRQLPAGSVVSIGNFDGIHLGHRRILEVAESLRAQAPSHRVAVVTFEPHPLTVLRPGHAPPRLTTSAMKRALLDDAGVDDLVVLPPSQRVLDLTAEQFWGLLRDEVRPAWLVEGPTFNFGKGRGGNIDRLREWAAAAGVGLRIVEPVSAALLDLQVVPVSSSVIRWLIDLGRVRDAAICLGRPYALEGPVVKGHRRGRAIGVPTANLDCGEQLLPADGVYAARAEAGGGTTYPVALSIGTLPTFGPNARQVEAHLIGFDGDLYGTTLHVEVIDWLREQRKFNGVEALKARLARDIEDVLERSGINPAVPIGALAS
jgi:riboflavin kinase / FMN adenylyltransferase